MLLEESCDGELKRPLLHRTSSIFRRGVAIRDERACCFQADTRRFAMASASKCAGEFEDDGSAMIAAGYSTRARIELELCVYRLIKKVRNVTRFHSRYAWTFELLDLQ